MSIRPQGKELPMQEQLEQELGVYVGRVSTDEVIRALAGHTPGEWVMQLADPSGATLWHKQGWSWEIVEGENRVVFTVAGTEQGAGIPSLYVDAPVVLS